MTKRVLIAEDDPSSLTLLQIILESDGGFEIATATDGEAAWTLLEGGTGFDVCIFDIMMPLLDGLALTKRIRAHPLLADQPVIFCTALNDRPSVDQAAALGVSHYIVKPYARERVIKQLKQVCATPRATAKLAPFAFTAQRLGITEPQVVTFLGRVARNTGELIAALRAGPAAPGEPTALVRVNGLKGAAVNFGAHGLFQALTALETHCSGDATAVTGEALHDVEREAERLNAQLAAAAPAAAPVAPAATPAAPAAAPAAAAPASPKTTPTPVPS